MCTKFVSIIILCCIACGCGKKSSADNELRTELKNLGVQHFFEDGENIIGIFSMEPKQNIEITHKPQKTSRVGVFVVNGDELAKKYKDVILLTNPQKNEYLKTYHKAARIFTPGEDGLINLVVKNLADEKIIVIVYCKSV
jgi:hypothetical protein